MLNRSRTPTILPTFQRLQAAMREFDHNNRMNMNMGMANANSNSNIARPSNPQISSCGAASLNNNSINNLNAPLTTTGNWKDAGDELRRLRSQVVITIERMLRSHQPHDVLTQVPENTDWRSKTFVLALKIERLMFLTAPSRENYLNENTLRSRVQLLSRHLVRIRKRKNAMATLGA